jgi:[ribosomal protein S5]-alanine N-acetyltransferase
MLLLDILVLRPLEETDVEQLYQFRNNFEITQYLGGFSRGFSRTSLLDWIKFHRQQSDEVLWGIALKADNRCIGHIGLYKIDHRVQKAELGILIGDQNYQGQGLGTKIAQAMVDYGFQQLNLNKISAIVLSHNERSLRLFSKLGFRQEGILRDEYFLQGKHIDGILFSYLKRDWIKHH